MEKVDASPSNPLPREEGISSGGGDRRRWRQEGTVTNRNGGNTRMVTEGALFVFRLYGKIKLD